MNITVKLSNGAVKPVDLSVFEDFIGQKTAINVIKFFVESSSDETPFPTLLFTGSHGRGKTYLAGKLSKALGRKLVVCNCGNIKKKEDFIKEVIGKVEGPTTIFLDESHSLSKEITTLLLTLLNPTYKYETSLFNNGIEFVHDLRAVNVVLATTDAHMMFKPLRNRCHNIYFSPYEKDSLIDILRFYLGEIKLMCNHDDLADACRSRARDAFLLSQNILRFIRMSNIAILTEVEWTAIKDIFNISHLGLNQEEVSLLKVVKDFGPLSCSSLAVKLMVNEENIKSELEVRLKELGLIKNTTQGRQITSKGIEYFCHRP